MNEYLLDWQKEYLKKKIQLIEDKKYFEFFKDAFVLSNVNKVVDNLPDYYQETIYLLYDYLTHHGIDIIHNVKQIGFGMFMCSNILEDITIPENVKIVSPSTFSYCENLQTVKFLGVEEIGSLVFTDCENLQSIYLPDTLHRIESDTFERCNSDADIKYNGTVQQFQSIMHKSSITRISKTVTKIHCLDGYLEV